ncbi:unnamed protein product [Protopolystoma xenopodis]|uniref:Uncharacterized protein n=1 Tax=Protopolystoma xenopodis TaxID=117903 RepID=A0A3S5FHC1_9PLAT|nr:unnamed protein product [Protopolystoma xenopodis]
MAIAHVHGSQTMPVSEEASFGPHKNSLALMPLVGAAECFGSCLRVCATSWQDGVDRLHACTGRGAG